MSEPEITRADLARIVTFVAASTDMKYLHPRKVQELFTPYAEARDRERVFLPFTEAEFELLADHEALWEELKVILGDAQSPMWGLAIDTTILPMDEFENLEDKSTAYTLCLIRAMHAFGMFPGYQ